MSNDMRPGFELIRTAPVPIAKHALIVTHWLQGAGVTR